jgi:predicted O-methyltransferase YrrM
MNSLTIPPVADVLRRLFEDAKEVDRPLLEQFAGGDEAAADEAWTQMLQEEKNEYRKVYQRFSKNYLNINPQLGRFLYMLARTRPAKRIVEFGTSFGISTIYLACALRDNGGGHLIGTELEPAKAKLAEENLKAAGLADLVEIRIGDALETLRHHDVPIDLVLLDGAITLYLPVLKILEPHLASGALVVGENAVKQSPAYREYVRDPRNGYLSVPLKFRDGNELSLRTE